MDIIHSYKSGMVCFLDFQMKDKDNIFQHSCYLLLQSIVKFPRNKHLQLPTVSHWAKIEVTQRLHKFPKCCLILGQNEMFGSRRKRIHSLQLSPD